jgi:hypothetical protein
MSASLGSILAPLMQIGPRISGQVLGLPFRQYRPLAAGALLPANLVNPALLCWITADKTGMDASPAAYAKPVMYSLHDPTLTLVGDYLVGSVTPGGPEMVFFIASQDVPAPMQVVRCNAVANLVRPKGNSAAGLNSYGGQTEATDVPVITGWPVSLLIKSKGSSGPANLPGDDKFALFEVLMPAVQGIELRSSDILTDDVIVNGAPRRFTLTATEQTNLGWRIQGQLSVT